MHEPLALGLGQAPYVADHMHTVLKPLKLFNAGAVQCWSRHCPPNLHRCTALSSLGFCVSDSEYVWRCKYRTPSTQEALLPAFAQVNLNGVACTLLLPNNTASTGELVTKALPLISQGWPRVSRVLSTVSSSPHVD